MDESAQVHAVQPQVGSVLADWEYHFSAHVTVVISRSGVGVVFERKRSGRRKERHSQWVAFAARYQLVSLGSNASDVKLTQAPFLMGRLVQYRRRERLWDRNWSLGRTACTKNIL